MIPLALEFSGLEFSAGDVLTIIIIGGGFIVNSLLSQARSNTYAALTTKAIEELKQNEERERERTEDSLSKLHGRVNRLSERVAESNGRLKGIERELRTRNGRQRH